MSKEAVKRAKSKFSNRLLEGILISSFALFPQYSEARNPILSWCAPEERVNGETLPPSEIKGYPVYENLNNNGWTLYEFVSQNSSYVDEEGCVDFPLDKANIRDQGRYKLKTADVDNKTSEFSNVVSVNYSNYLRNDEAQTPSDNNKSIGGGSSQLSDGDYTKIGGGDSQLSDGESKYIINDDENYNGDIFIMSDDQSLNDNQLITPRIYNVQVSRNPDNVYGDVKINSLEDRLSLDNTSSNSDVGYYVSFDLDTIVGSKNLNWFSYNISSNLDSTLIFSVKSGDNIYRHEERIHKGDNQGSILLNDFVKYEELPESDSQIKIRLKDNGVSPSIYGVGISGGTNDIEINSLDFGK